MLWFYVQKQYTQYTQKALVYCTGSFTKDIHHTQNLQSCTWMELQFRTIIAYIQLRPTSYKVNKIFLFNFQHVNCIQNLPMIANVCYSYEACTQLQNYPPPNPEIFCGMKWLVLGCEHAYCYHLDMTLCNLCKSAVMFQRNISLLLDTGDIYTDGGVTFLQNIWNYMFQQLQTYAFWDKGFQ